MSSISDWTLAARRALRATLPSGSHALAHLLRPVVDEDDLRVPTTDSWDHEKVPAVGTHVVVLVDRAREERPSNNFRRSVTETVEPNASDAAMTSFPRR